MKKEGVEILIALGHSGYELDVQMAAEIGELDVVVGGHSHTFLWTGENLIVCIPNSILLFIFLIVFNSIFIFILFPHICCFFMVIKMEWSEVERSYF